ncbi:MAG: hypothetical protein ACI9R7_002543, partial [Lysobacterales bacterium]
WSTSRFISGRLCASFPKQGLLYDFWQLLT